MTIKDVAKKANVSTATVSRVINNKSEGITEEMRQHVQKVIDEMGYTPSHLARGMVTKKTYTIGLVIQDIRNPFFPKMVSGVEHVAYNHGYMVLLCNTDEDLNREKDYIATLREKRVDGIIITVSNGIDRAYIAQLTKGDIPFVFLDEIAEEVNCVCVDNTLGAYQATKHLIQLGHKHIACLSGPSTSITNLNRVDGYKKALMEAGLPINKDLILKGSYKADSGYKSAESILKDFPHVTALFCANDFNALGAYKAVVAHGKRVPEDISIVGFDDILDIPANHFAFTSVSQPTYEMGQAAATMLMDMIHKKPMNEPFMTFEPKLIVRDSTSSPL
ncbi:LacI family DNA-binding transcriptional regulator [Vallitalea pronyensis]|uniref:LacI family DNA-binding transcriptional regulator n=1 Tax=Vallitalea pronyensis TaxID=1348613 RepID=A0A8J8MK45_9FIRM|nr:LacI family DNA-binding transcriptional regulator [Vallitalea pronyensis]QUI23154.1 LacI family DNA-binding transcriptional regulator [Vallitalea pronyensis]